MDINIVYDEMVEKLKASNNQNVLEELEKSDAGASTGSEALSMTGFYLSSLKRNNPSIYELLKEQIKEYLKYCQKNGIIIS
ncbi:MAG: hypothetical protein P4L51_00785 [Puia sp.]|nr:hypothetical protein [Puia sp.]